MATPTTPSPGDDWFYVGPASSFPNITAATSSEPYFKLAWPQSCSTNGSSPTPAAKIPGCKVFHPKAKSTGAVEIDIEDAPGEDGWAMREQVVVFQYEGTFRAVDHACPHRAWSMAWGRPFDIEDSGKVVGQGMRCRGHGYAFELSTGEGDRGSYKLGVWEVEVRSTAAPAGGGVVLGEGEGDGKGEREVWVRRRKSAEAGQPLDGRE